MGKGKIHYFHDCVPYNAVGQNFAGRKTQKTRKIFSISKRERLILFVFKKKSKDKSLLKRRGLALGDVKKRMSTLKAFFLKKQ